MHRLRHLANELGLTKPSDREDWEVLDFLARQMAAQRLVVVRRLILSRGGSSDESQQATAPGSAASPQVRDRTLEPDPPTFDPDVQQDQQAGALIGASKDAVPFCEECARLAAGKAA